MMMSGSCLRIDRSALAKVRSDLGMNLDLVDSLELVLDRVLHIDDLLSRGVELGQGRVKGGGLARARRACDQQDSVRTRQQRVEARSSVSASKPICSRLKRTLARSSTRITTLSPCTVGTVDTRRSSSRPLTRVLIRPSCGRRRSAMSRRASSLMREADGCAVLGRHRLGRMNDAIDAIAHMQTVVEGLQVDVGSAQVDHATDDGVDQAGSPVLRSRDRSDARRSRRNQPRPAGSSSSSGAWWPVATRLFRCRSEAL